MITFWFLLGNKFETDMQKNGVQHGYSCKLGGRKPCFVFFSFGQQWFGLDKQSSASYQIINFYFYFQLRLAGLDKHRIPSLQKYLVVGRN